MGYVIRLLIALVLFGIFSARTVFAEDKFEFGERYEYAAMECKDRTVGPVTVKCYDSGGGVVSYPCGGGAQCSMDINKSECIPAAIGAMACKYELSEIYKKCYSVRTKTQEEASKAGCNLHGEGEKNDVPAGSTGPLYPPAGRTDLVAVCNRFSELYKQAGEEGSKCVSNPNGDYQKKVQVCEENDRAVNICLGLLK